MKPRSSVLKITSPFYSRKMKKILVSVIVIAIALGIYSLAKYNSSGEKKRRQSKALVEATYTVDIFVYAIDAETGDILNSTGLLGFSVGKTDPVYKFNDLENLGDTESSYHIGHTFPAPLSAKNGNYPKYGNNFWKEYKGQVKRHLSILASDKITVFFESTGYENSFLTLNSDGKMSFSGSKIFHEMNAGKKVLGPARDENDIATIVVPLTPIVSR